MRLSEKTIELNFTAQFQLPRRRIIWTGLTQAQEALLGYDMSADLGGRMALFQFKASDVTLKDGSRKFMAQDQQMRRLKTCSLALGCPTLYVLPNIGTTNEFAAAHFNLLSKCFFVDVASITTIPAVTRQDGYHSMYLYSRSRPSYVEIWSEPVRANAIRLHEVIEGLTSPIKKLSRSNRGAFEDLLNDKASRRTTAAFIFDK